MHGDSYLWERSLFMVLAIIIIQIFKTKLLCCGDSYLWECSLFMVLAIIIIQIFKTKLLCCGDTIFGNVAYLWF